MESENSNKSYLPVEASKSFLCSLFDALCVFVLTVSFYFALLKPINSTKLNDLSMDREDSYQTILRVGKESALLKNDEANTSVFNKTSYYEYFTASILKTDYESDIYDKEIDFEGYNQSKDKLEELDVIQIEGNVIKDNLLGFFYTSFCPGRLNLEGSKLVSYSSEEAVEYYLETILGANDALRGGRFFQPTQKGEFPHFKENVRSHLFDYLVNHVPVADAVEIDREFYAYFNDIFNDASNLLLSDSIYGEAFNTFNNSNGNLIKSQTLYICLSYFLSILVCLAVIPEVSKKKATLGNIVTKTQNLNDDEKFPIHIRGLRLLIGLLKYFFVLVLLVYVVEDKILTYPLFYLGSAGISLSLFLAMSAIFCLVSLIVSLVDKENRSLENLLCQTYLVKEFRKFVNNRTSDTDLV